MREEDVRHIQYRVRNVSWSSFPFRGKTHCFDLTIGQCRQLPTSRSVEVRKIGKHNQPVVNS